MNKRWPWLSLTVMLGAAPAGAQAGPVVAPAGAAAACTQGKRAALSEIACDLAQQLAGAPTGALVVAAPLAGDAKAQAPERITARVAGVVAGALARNARSTDEVATLTCARTLASSAGTLVHLQVEIAHGEISVVADVYPVPRSFWDRVRDPEPSPTLHAFASRRLDAELRALLPPVPLVASRIDKATAPVRGAVAVGCGDVDGDGALELVLVGRRAIHVGRIRHGAFVDSASRRWDTLSPIAVAPLREPIGTIAIEPGRSVDVGISDREEGVRLDGALSPLQKLGHRMPWPGGGCTRVAGIALGSGIEPCAPGDNATTRAAGQPADAVAGAVVVDRNGKTRTVRAARIAGEPTVVLDDETGRSARVEGAGAQLAVGDLDGDGAPELLTGASTPDPAGDALIVYTWRDDGQVVERLRVAVPTGVFSIAVCPPEASTLAPIAMGTGDGVWVIR